MSTIEYVRFASAERAALIASRDQLVEVLRARYGADFQGAHLAAGPEDGSFVEFVIWSSPEAAARAAQEMPTGPAAAGFFDVIGEVHEMRHAQVLHSTA
jgi:hypothetical protein